MISFCFSWGTGFFGVAGLAFSMFRLSVAVLRLLPGVCMALRDEMFYLYVLLYATLRCSFSLGELF